MSEQAVILRLHIEQVTRSSPYKERLLRRKREGEKFVINGSGGLRETYNTPKSFDELTHTLHSCISSDPDADNMHYLMFKGINFFTLELILIMFHRIWMEGYVPTAWRKAVVIRLFKTEKLPHLPTNYRPKA